MSLPDDNLDLADSIFLFTTLFAHVPPNSSTQLVFISHMSTWPMVINASISLTVTFEF